MIKATYRLSKYFIIIITSFSLLFLAGCNLFKGTSNSAQPSYKELKGMVIDILQTEEGKKAVQESLSDPKVNKKMILSNDEVAKVVQSEFLSPENKDKLKKMYEDPKFAAELGETLKKENEKILKDLLKDPEYRKMLIETMNDPEFEKMLLEVMKTSPYRRQMMLVIKDSLESPMFKDDLLKLMEKANEEALKPETEQKDKEKDK